MGYSPCGHLYSYLPLSLNGPIRERGTKGVRVPRGLG